MEQYIAEKSKTKNLDETAMKSLLSSWVAPYALQGDYLIPDLKLPKEGRKTIGVWGHRHKHYLQEHKRVIYITLLTSGKPNDYLTYIDEQIEEMFSGLVMQMAERACYRNY